MANIDFSAAVKNGKKAVPAPVDPFDVAPIKKQLGPYKKAVDDLTKIAVAHTVTDEKSAKKATDMGKQVQDLRKKLEAMRKELVKEPNDYVSKVNGLVKSFTEGGLKTSLTHLKKVVGDYEYKKELKRREEEKKAQEEARKMQESLDKEAQEKGVESVEVAPPVLPPASTVTRTEGGASSHLRKNWTHEILDAAQVPREYCNPDPKLIRQAVDGGIREIPGVKIFEKPQAVFK